MLPTRDRVWTLEGVEESEDKTKRTERNPETGEILEIDVIEQETILEEVIEAPTAIAVDPVADKWNLWFQEVLHRQQVCGFKPGWIYYQIVEAKPPLHIWEKFAELRGYKKSWAKYRYEEQEGIQTTEDVSANEPDWESIWQEVINQLSPVSRTLFATYAHLASVEGHQVFLKVRSEPLLKIMRPKKIDLETAFYQVTEQNLTVRLITSSDPMEH
ncbi:MAG: hypothetical protein ACKOX2_05065 [Microcystaceae cyanobacterium]